MMTSVEKEACKEQSYHAGIPEIVLIVGLTAAAVVGNFVVTRYYWNLDIRPPAELILSAFLGLLIAQVCLPAIWCGLGRGWMFGRIAPVCVFLIATWSYLGTFMVLDGSLPTIVAVTITVASLALFAVLQMPLWSIRSANSFSLSKSDIGEDRVGRPQFNIRHMLIVTAIAATLLAVVRGLAQYLDSGDRQLPQPTGELIFFFTVFIVFVSILCLFAAAAVFSHRRRWLYGGLLTLLWIVGSLAVAWSLRFGCSFIYVVGGTAVLRIFSNTLAFSGMLVVAIVAVLTAFRGLGYRLRAYDAE